MLSIFGGEFVACPLGHSVIDPICSNHSPHVLLQNFKGGLGVAILLQFKSGALVPGLWKYTLTPLAM